MVPVSVDSVDRGRAGWSGSWDGRQGEESNEVRLWYGRYWVDVWRKVSGCMRHLSHFGALLAEAAEAEA